VALATSAAATAAPAATSTSVAPDLTPLLTYASSHHFPPVFAPEAQIGLQKKVSRITFDLAKDPPPATDCARTLGARRFATLYDELAQAYSNMGKHVEALEAYAKAIECNPRADFLHAELAASLLDLGRYSDARMETQRQLRLGRANFTLYTLITQLDFIEDRWPEAINSARIAATDAPNDEQATYWQCFLWLAQLHAGITEPVLVKRRIAETWPAPILESLQGQITEMELVEAVAEERDPQRQRDILSEALFYTGQQRLAGRHVDEAVKYFTATVDLKVLYFIEHQLATAELSKLRRAGPYDHN
jgi:Tetratricopeptide repeat